MAATRVLLVGDTAGVQQVLDMLPVGLVVGLVTASNRPQYHEELGGIAGALGVPLLSQPSSSAGEHGRFVELAAALRPELILVNSYSMILRPEVLALAPGVNVHGGRLPQYRGANPIQWQLLADEREAGVTMHELATKVDAGPIVAERSVPIRFEDTWQDVSARVSDAAATLLRETLPAVLAGSAPSRPQDETVSRTWPRRTPDDGRIDWNWSVLQIYNLVRALGGGIPPAFHDRHGQREEVEGLSAGEVAALAYAPGPGGRLLERGDVRLLPEGGPLGDFRVLRGGRATGNVRLEPVDLDVRVARVLADPEDADAAALADRFARTEFGFVVER